METITTQEATVELLVGSYISRKTGKSVRVVRVNGTQIYRGYVNGVLTLEGTRRAAMKLAQI